MSLSLPQAVDTQAPKGGEWDMDAFSEALRREAKLLLDLAEVLERQRAAVARDDLAVVDETVYSAQRVFRTLAEARRRRKALLDILGIDPEVGLDSLETVLGPRMTVDVGLARTELKEAARRLSSALTVNRQVLQGAISSGEELIKGLTGAGGADPGVYGPPATERPSSGESGLILDRQI
jgi:hypothetical protein